MKRSFCAVLAVVMLLSLSACGASPEAKAVNELIRQIGTVGLESENEILAAERAYSQLDAEQQAQVKQYDKLLRCRAYYEYLLSVEEYNASAEEYNSAIGGYNGKVSAYAAEYNAYSELVDAAEALDASGPAYDESTKEVVMADVSAAADYFKRKPEIMSVIDLLSPDEMGSKKADRIRDMAAQLRQMTRELENMVSEIGEKAGDLSGGGELLDRLRKGLEGFAESISVMKTISNPQVDMTAEKLSNIGKLFGIEQGTYATGHNGSVFFQISPECFGDTSGAAEYKGSVEIYGTEAEAGISAERLSAMSGIIGPVYFEGMYLVRFGANVPAEAAGAIASEILAALR